MLTADGSALVTGASRGIGRAVALELGRRGFDVVGTVRTPEAGEALVHEASALGISLSTRLLEMTDVGTLDLPADLRVVVNNAGAQEAYFPVETLPLDVLRQLLEVNLVGQVAVLQQAIPVLRERGDGVVCNITSISVVMASPFFAAYRASKAAMSAVCETLLVELAPFGIRVLEVMPGPVATDGLNHSDHIDAVEFAPYRDRAERMMASRGAVHGAAVTTDAAATRIVDTILSDDGPMRSSCDPMGDRMLEEWRTTPDTAQLDAVLRRFGS